jgi:hypothetical protein
MGIGCADKSEQKCEFDCARGCARNGLCRARHLHTQRGVCVVGSAQGRLGAQCKCCFRQQRADLNGASRVHNGEEPASGSLSVRRQVRQLLRTHRQTPLLSVQNHSSPKPTSVVLTMVTACRDSHQHHRRGKMFTEAKYFD